MKKILLTTLITLNAFAVNVQPVQTTVVSGDMTHINKDKELIWVDEQIQAILPARVGVAEGFINSLSDPIKLKHTPVATTGKSSLLPPPKLGCPPDKLLPPKIVEEPLRLQALINKSALINGKWYRINDSVRAYTLTEIKNTSVLLSGKKGQKLILFLTKQNNNVKITTK